MSHDMTLQQATTHDIVASHSRHSSHDTSSEVMTSHGCDCHRRRVLSTAVLQQKMAENDRRMSSRSDMDSDTRQLLEDERLALLLQSEEFLAELRQNEDFMRTLEHGLLLALN